jgi:NAD(P)-dependent dehydrogenase (short-subunit alcohol dehydrogenase family)
MCGLTWQAALMDLELKGRRAIVMGGSRGISKQVARALVLEQVETVIAARDATTLEAAADEIAAETGNRPLPLTCDTARDESVRAAVSAALEHLGGIDILVNAAATPALGTPPTLAQIDDDAFWSDVNVKVMGYLRCIREVVPTMAAAGGGRVVNISGYSARVTGSTIGSIRNVSISAMTKTLADELASQGIRLNAVHPAFTRTEKTSAVVARQADTLNVSEEQVERDLGVGSLLGRIVEAREVAYVVAFLASPKAIAVNGDTIGVGGGLPGWISY